MPETTGLVAWNELRVGKTYWLVCHHSLSPVEVNIKELGREGFCSSRNCWWFKNDFTWDDQPAPMIYRTCADACRAMIARLEQFMQEQEEGNA